MILMPKFELIETLKLISKLKPTMMPGVPTLFAAMLRHPHIAIAIFPRSNSASPAAPRCRPG